MKNIEKLNTTTKMLLVLLYSFILLLVASLLINIADAEDETKGYGTKAHYSAITQYGASPIHRMSFLKKFYGTD